jgi:chemotaxis response regulator CheB
MPVGPVSAEMEASGSGSTTGNRVINVLVVEDSPVGRDFLVYVLASDPEIQVIAATNNGEEALEAVERTKPDIITMDIYMSGMNGLEATRSIMAALSNLVNRA